MFKLLFLLVLIIAHITCCFASTKANSPPAYQILSSTNTYLSVKIDISRFNLSIQYKKGLSNDYLISFSTNYSERNVPIGVLKQENVNYYCMKSRYDKIRPCLVINNNKISITKNQTLIKDKASTVFQGGPTLISAGKVCVKSNEEHFRYDAIRTTKQLSVGVTKTNKLIVVYSTNCPLTKISNILLKYQCIDAMKFDGGHEAALKINTPEHKIFKGNKGIVPAAFCLSQKEEILLQPFKLNIPYTFDIRPKYDYFDNYFYNTLSLNHLNMER